VHALSSTLVGRELNFWSLSGWIENPRRALAQRARSGCRASHKRKAARGRALHKVHFNVHMSPTVHFTSKITHINPSRQSNDSGGRKATRWGAAATTQRENGRGDANSTSAPRFSKATVCNGDVALGSLAALSASVRVDSRSVCCCSTVASAPVSAAAQSAALSAHLTVRSPVISSLP